MLESMFQHRKRFDDMFRCAKHMFCHYVVNYWWERSVFVARWFGTGYWAKVQRIKLSRNSSWITGIKGFDLLWRAIPAQPRAKSPSNNM